MAPQKSSTHDFLLESSESEDDDEANKENTAKTKKKKQLPTTVYAELKKVLK